MLKKFTLLFIFLSLTGTSFFYYRYIPPDNLEKTVFKKLKIIRTEKKNNVLKHFNKIQRMALYVKKDKKLKKIYRAMLNNRNQTDQQIEYELDRHFVKYYGNFYDLLFTDRQGNVFHSIRKESDFKKNILHGTFKATKLSRKLKNYPDTDFSDYEFYAPSHEPAAFFIVTIPEKNKDGSDITQKNTGWIILQCSTNSINTILTEREHLGRTGEVYLVNNKKLMLSDSRFMEDSTILKLKVDTDAVKKALAYREGEHIIKDYRGKTVFSSFEKFNVFGSDWIIIAEIDESEAYTSYYKKYKFFLGPKILAHIRKSPLLKKALKTRKCDNATRVDLDEFQKAPPGACLSTMGVSTCTAVAVVYPGKFGYMAHISPTDRIYGHNFLTSRWLGEHYTDLLDEIIHRLCHFDVYPYEIDQLQGYICATHDKSLLNAVDIMVEYGMNLNNIRVFINTEADIVNLNADIETNFLSAQWISRNTSYYTSNNDISNLEQIIKHILLKNNQS
jgi:hypothetical protein